MKMAWHQQMSCLPFGAVSLVIIADLNSLFGTDNLIVTLGELMRVTLLTMNDARSKTTSQSLEWKLWKFFLLTEGWIYLFVWTSFNVQVIFADKCIFNWPTELKNDSLISQLFHCIKIYLWSGFSAIIIVRCLKLNHNHRGKFDHSKLLYSLCLGFYSADSRSSLLVYQTPWRQQKKKNYYMLHPVSSFLSCAPIDTHFRSLPAWSINPVECVPATPQLRRSVIFGPRLISVHRQETCKGRPTWRECI